MIAAVASKGTVRRIFARHLLLPPPPPPPPPLLVFFVSCAYRADCGRREQCNIRARSRRLSSSCWPNAIPRQNVRTTDLVLFFLLLPTLAAIYSCSPTYRHNTITYLLIKQKKIKTFFVRVRVMMNNFFLNGPCVSLLQLYDLAVCPNGKRLV